MKCRYCGCNMARLDKQRNLELSVMKIIYTYLCKKCRRTAKRTEEIYMLVQGVPLNAEAPAPKQGGL